jgi:ATP-dependent exoDNAse (exonuclease V) alpha subunit
MDNFKIDQLNKSNNINYFIQEQSLTFEQQKVIDIVKNNNFSKESILFITGSAGTGKSTLLMALRNFFTINKLNAVFLAPTGMGAINIQGQTIHSFFRLQPRLLLDDILNVYEPPAVLKSIINKLDYLIIDEVSMVRADLFDTIDLILKRERNSPFPFGGVKIILFGDLMQLPPVVRNDENIFFEFYETPFFFSSNVISDVDIFVFELKNILRQDDEKFIQFLQKIRNRELTKSNLEFVNSLCYRNKFQYEEYGIILSSTNYIAKNYNEQKLNEINEELKISKGMIKGDFPIEELPTEYELKLKKSAKVMLTVNDTEKRWVNGTLGIIKEFEGDKIIVELENKSVVEITKVNYLKYKYQINEQKKIECVPVGSFFQYPLKLAWAMTIHKSQGLTLNKITLNLGRGSFAHGQTYVGLSRVRKLDNIKLSQELKISDIIIANEVEDFYSNKRIGIKRLN